MLLLFACAGNKIADTSHFNVVDQVLWVVDDLDNVISNWENLGFGEIMNMDTVQFRTGNSADPVPMRMAKANLGGAHITWIQPLESQSIFARFHSIYGDGAMSLVHHLKDRNALNRELERLSKLGVEVLDEVTVSTPDGDLHYVLMDTWKEGKYILGYDFGETHERFFGETDGENTFGLKINQYAFAIRDWEPVSHFWASLGQPEFAINHPVLGNKHYYGKPADHELIQGWQRHGTIAYEWCIPVKMPIVYDDHIKLHGEGIQHLAFTVKDMNQVLGDYESKGYVNSMGGTWGDEGKPGSGRYEYVNLEKAGGVTMELLWSYPPE